MAKDIMTETETSSKKNVLPLRDGIFTIPSSSSEEPHLIGCRCSGCGESFVGRRSFCASCTSDDLEQDILLSNTGKLNSYTIVHQAPSAVWGGAPYAIGWIDLPEGVRVTARLHRFELDSIEVGTEVQLELVAVAEDDENKYLNYVFVPT